jgi:N-carbamoyl-L-amino-acid hydrolase
MNERHDALTAAAEIVLGVERAARSESAHDSVATTAVVECLPGAVNVIPGTVTLLVDVRGIDAESMRRVVSGIEQASAEVGSRRGVGARVELLSQGVPTRFHPSVVGELERTVQEIGYQPLLLPSGAGHDVQSVAATAQTGMLFVPSVGGISHSPEEFTRDEDVVAGVRALAACWWCLASGHEGMQA